MKNLFENIIGYLIEKSRYNNYNKEILEYGFKVLLFNFFTFFLIIIISILFSNLSFGIFFLITFSFLRITIGGFHAKTIYLCTSLMIIILVILLSLSNLASFYVFLKTISIIAIIFLIFIHPSKKNTISTKNIQNYNLFLLLIFSFLYFLTFSYSYLFIPIFSSLVTTEILYLVNKLKE